ncbi:MAG TPA: hypothetical protein VIJ19_08870 [Opitutaceae bacterium]
MMRKAVSREVFLFLCLMMPLRADQQPGSKATPVPDQVWQKPFVVSPDWLGRIPPTGSVNVPEFSETLYPGEKLALALGTNGPDHERLLEGASVNVQVSLAGHAVYSESKLTQKGSRPIKAEGSDFALAVLKAGGIAMKDQAGLEKAMAGQTLAVFQTEWAAPSADNDEDALLTVTLNGKLSGTSLEPIHIKLRPTASWLKDTPGTLEEFGKYLNRYHDNLPPGQLLLLLKTAEAKGGLNSASALSFFSMAFRERPEDRSAAIAAFPSLDPKMKLAVAVAFRLGGLDISGFLPGLPANVTDSLKNAEALKDPRTSMSYSDPISVDVVRGIGTTMDECWGGWMATGDKSYLRALVGLLSGAPDYPVLENWVKTKGGVKGLNASVARGLAYQTAGWSIGAFERADPHVADWIAYWSADPGFPQPLVSELASIPVNPAFRHN